MKGISKFLSWFLCAMVLLVAACSNQAGQPAQKDFSEYERDVSIYNGDRSASGIQSYQANVKTYYSHDRKGIEMQPGEEYRLSMKMIDGKVYTRLDYGASMFPDGKARSIISDTDESIVFFPDSMRIEQRIPIPENQKRFLLDSNNLSPMGKYDLNRVVSEARRLSFDIDDATPGALFVNVPADTFPATGNGTGYESRVTKYRLSFDTGENTLVSTEMVVAESTGTETTVTSYPLYKETDGEPVKVGEVMTVKNDIPGTLDVSDSAVQEYASLEDIPRVSADEISRLESEGKISTVDVPVLLGNQSDPDFTETHVQLYDDVKLNTLSDSYFRLFQ